MANEIPLSPEELDYAERAQKIYNERIKNPNSSDYTILTEKIYSDIIKKNSRF